VLASNRYLDLRHEAAHPDRDDSTDELISAADAAEHEPGFIRGLGAGPEKQTIHFGERDAMMPSGGLDAANALSVNPLLDRWKTDS
jgi:hypothetical protein